MSLFSVTQNWSCWKYSLLNRLTVHQTPKLVSAVPYTLVRPRDLAQWTTATPHWLVIWNFFKVVLCKSSVSLSLCWFCDDSACFMFLSGILLSSSQSANFCGRSKLLWQDLTGFDSRIISLHTYVTSSCAQNDSLFLKLTGVQATTHTYVYHTILLP